MDIKCTNLSKKFGNFFALQDINLELSNGIYGLLGANGAGKTTFIKILMKIIGKYEGSIEMQKVDIKSTNDSFFEHIGYLPQYPQFYKNFSAIDMSTLFCTI